MEQGSGVVSSDDLLNRIKNSEKKLLNLSALGALQPPDGERKC